MNSGSVAADRPRPPERHRRHAPIRAVDRTARDRRAACSTSWNTWMYRPMRSTPTWSAKIASNTEASSSSGSRVATGRRCQRGGSNGARRPGTRCRRRICTRGQCRVPESSRAAPCIPLVRAVSWFLRRRPITKEMALGRSTRALWHRNWEGQGCAARPYGLSTVRSHNPLAVYQLSATLHPSPLPTFRLGQPK